MNEEMKQQVRSICASDEIANELIVKLEKDEEIAEDMKTVEKETFCEYPMRDFYVFREDVPPNVRVSTPEDCEACDEDCIVKHCIITESVGKKPEKEKKCESHCPFCNGKNIDWGDCFSVTDGWYHQRATCLDCDSCFTEAMELVYKSTLLTEE